MLIKPFKNTKPLCNYLKKTLKTKWPKHWPKL